MERFYISPAESPQRAMAGMRMVADFQKAATQRWLRSTKRLRPGDFQDSISPEITGEHLDLTWAGTALNGAQTEVTWQSTSLKETWLPEEFPSGIRWNKYTSSGELFRGS